MNLQGKLYGEVIGELKARKSKDPDLNSAHLFGLVYPTGREDIESLVSEVSQMYLFENALNPFKFPELAHLEEEVITTVSNLLSRKETSRRGGAMTSGGTESILLSMNVHKARACAKGIKSPKIVAATSAHPAYAKAASYFDLELIQIPLDNSFRPDLDALKEAVTEQTAVVIASAFCYPYGVMDQVEEIASIAQSVGAGCHVDACIGGFVLPFLERLGKEVPPFDFRVPGVTSISADVHKYGYVPKGASVILYRDDDWMDHQVFLYDKWGSGLYGSASIAGARPGAPIATSWAVMAYLGVTGYCELMKSVMTVSDQFSDLVRSTDQVELVGNPIGPVVALQSDQLDLFGVGETMEKKGWHLNRNTSPRGLHLMFSPIHEKVIDALCSDFEEAVNNHENANSEQARYS